MSKILELFGIQTHANETSLTQVIAEPQLSWKEIVSQQHCPYLGRKCVKVRKSEPEISIGTCSVQYGAGNASDLVICPFRLLERKQVFMDSIHLLSLHEPGNELHLIPEISIPGGSVDYFLVSVRDEKVMDYLGIELQALDTTGTVWPNRQAFLASVGVIPMNQVPPAKPYGINWKMTAKTILVQLHHKISTFEHLSKHLVLVVQDHLLDYMKREFTFDHIAEAKLGDPMHFHSYSLVPKSGRIHLALADRKSTDTAGIARCLGLQADPRIEQDAILTMLQARISTKTLFTI